MRTLRALTTMSLLAVLVVPAGQAPAAAVEAIRAEGSVYAGLYSAEWESAADVTALNSWAGKGVTFAGSFHQPDENKHDNPNDTFSNTGWILEQAWLAHATPFANLEIPDDPAATAAAIAAGSYDAAITTWAGHVKAWLDMGGGRSLLIAPFPEMNGDWVPYGVDPVNFRAAYRRVVGIFRGLGMDETKVRWVFAPNGWSSHGYGYKIADYYPGDDVVDAIGISAYNFGAGFENGWEDIGRVFAPWIEEIRSTVTADKPYFIAQTASSSYGGDKNQWLVNLFEYAAADPNIVGFVYFNTDKETDWAVWRNPAGVTGWRTGMQRTATGYQWPLTAWFRPGPLPFAGPAAATPPCPDGADCDRLALVDGSSAFRLYDRVAAGASTSSFYYGQPADMALMGDWDCDGVATPAMYRPSNGFVYLRNSNSFGVAELDFFFGLAGDVPIVGDWNGDGCDTLGIYRPSEARVYVRNTLGTGVADLAYYYGVPGDRPFAGDFDGDGKSTVGLYRESTGFVYFRNTLSTGVADFDFFYGEPSDRILAGDWDGNGTDTVAVYRPSTGKVYFRNSNSQGTADYTLTVGGSYTAALAAG